MTDPDQTQPPTTERKCTCDERAGREECRALVRVRQRRNWDELGSRMVVAACYFSWLFYLTALLPLLLLNLRTYRSRPSAAFHVYAATAWSLLIAAIRALLLVGSMWAGTREGPLAESICNTLSMVHLVLVLTFALLLSTFYAIEALLGREADVPVIGRWAREKAKTLTGAAD